MTVPLEIPEPPPRIAMDPVPAVVAEDAPSVPERPPVTPAEKPRRRQRLRRTTAASPPPAVPPPVTDAGAAASDSAAGASARRRRPGRTPTAAQVRDRLVRTKQKLDSDQRRQLNAGKRADYDSARRFLSQAQAAVNANNLLLAESSVEKAETLADGLK